MGLTAENVAEEYRVSREAQDEFSFTSQMRAKKALEEAGFKYNYADVTMVPQSTVRLSGKEAEQMLKLMEGLEDSDDVQKVYGNFDIADEEMERLSA
jgi:transcriptional/translational regulatory protein YebC/TACO1